MANFFLLARAQKNKKAKIIIDFLNYHKLKNYVDLAILELNIFAAPSHTTYETTYEQFSNKIAKYLKDRDIPDIYIFGDNSSLITGMFDGAEDI
ncbi:hypothetical protein [Lactobacillus apis]|uniref:hypothetical protein n=1 Tax=Lactobacillus apis TaxID=303541 RepID=UPI00242F3112|nr:hypothetical protein [Lactobacillus apis]